MKTSSMYILRGMCILSLYNGPKFFKCFEGMVLGVNLSKLYSVAAFSRGAFDVATASRGVFYVATEWHRGVSSEASSVATEWHVGVSGVAFY